MSVTKGVIDKPANTQVLPAGLPRGASVAIQNAELASMQDELLVRSLNVVEGAMAFAEIEPTDSDPPAEWIEQLGEEKARIKFRIARAAWMAAKDAPVGIKVASALAVGIIKAKATEKAGPKQLNIAFVQMTAPLPQFVEQELER